MRCPVIATRSCGCGARPPARADASRATARYNRRDVYYERARDSGFRSRAAFKLEDLLRRLPRGALRSGGCALELGCWPGGWLQVLADRVGPKGRVLGVDLEAIDPLSPPIVFEALDITEPDAPAKIEALLGRRADAVFSDAAPKLTGIRDVDRAACEELYESALRVADRVLRPGGPLVIKGFPGPEADAFRKELRRRFGRAPEVRPEGKRSTSKEFYWLVTSRS